MSKPTPDHARGCEGRIYTCACGYDAQRDEALQALEEENERLLTANEETRKIVRDIYWMALRYADGRRSYAVGMVNDAVRKGYDAGWLVHSYDKDPAFARDGDKPEYRSLEERATAAEEENARLRQHVEELKQKNAAETCACSYDGPGTVCDGHSPKLAAAEAENARLRETVKDRERKIDHRLMQIGELKEVIEEALKVIEPFAKAGKLIDGGLVPSSPANDEQPFQFGIAWTENGERKTLTWGHLRAARRFTEESR
jgi:DNA repair exonuclease SbcCD ATPase subunit